VGHGVDERFLLGEGGILELLLEKEADQRSRLTDLGADGVVAFLDQAQQGAFRTLALDEIELRSDASLEALVAREVDAGAGMPAGRLPGEREHGG
jgi:hypothetical protein